MKQIQLEQIISFYDKWENITEIQDIVLYFCSLRISSTYDLYKNLKHTRVSRAYANVRVAVKALEDKGLLELDHEDMDNKHAPLPSAFYRITDKGKERLRLFV